MTPLFSRPLTCLIALMTGVIGGAASHAFAQGTSPAPHAATPPKIAQMPSSTSSSGQFVVHGSDLGTRGAFCLLCDDTASALGRMLHDNARYSIPVVVVLKGAPDVDRTGPAITTNISQLAHGGFHLQINVQLRADFQSDEFARELVRVLLAERILRNHAELTTKRDRVLPDWVLTGVTQALEFRARSRPSALFAAVFRGGQVFSVDKILSADPAQLDALSRTIYETSSCAIVLALLDQDQGPVRFGRFLNALALDDKPDRDLLKQFFPTLGASKNSLEKWWTLQMATLATPSALESMSIAETEQKLDEALTLRYEPLPEKEKEKKGKSKDGGKTSQAEPTTGAAFPFAHFAGLDNSTLFFNLACLWKSYVSGVEVAATSAKDPDADDTSSKKPKKKDAAKDKGSDNDKGKPQDKDKTKGKDQDKTAKKDEQKNDKKITSKKEPDKKEPEKKVTSKKDDDKKEPDKKAAKKKEDEDKKEAEKKLAAQKEDDKKKAAAAKKKEEDEKKESGKKAASKKESGKKEDEDKTSGLQGKPHHVAQLPPGISAPSPEESKKEESKEKGKGEPEEKPSGEKRSKWNPVHWFHGSGEKPAPETEAKTTSPAKHNHVASKSEPKPEAIASDKKSQGTIQDYVLIWKRPDRSAILLRNVELLNALRNQAHPLYRSLIAEYSEIVRNLSSGKDRGAKEKLGNLHDQYVKISNEAKAVESYLDWYEASETPNYSGTFDDYLKLRDKLDKAIRPRGDAISQYLDSLEKEYEN